MKKISILLFVVLFALFGCSKDETMVTISPDAKPAVITSKAPELARTITAETLGNDFIVKWDKADYGVSVETTYILQMDYACNEFKNPVTVSTTTNTSLTLTNDFLNTKLLENLYLAQHVASDVEFRVVSYVNGNYLQTSAPVSFSVTPWSGKPIGLWLSGKDWTTDKDPYVLATDETHFEGYAYLLKNKTFKFSTVRSCVNTSYGATGSVGELSADAAAPGIVSPDSGYFKINVDLEKMKYTMTLIKSWGLIGTATDFDWDKSTPLTYNISSGLWEGSAYLAEGALKFRADNAWAINYGPVVISDLKGSLKQTDDAINIPMGSQYNVILDLTQSKPPYTYSYTVEKIDEPAKLWLPGSYQGWKPNLAPVIHAINSTQYDGYVNISSGADGAGFKFTSAPDWDHINYGDAGTAGKLTTDGNKDGVSVPVGGYYRFTVDLGNLTYTATLINSMGMVGPATAGGSDTGWNSSVPMTYDPINDVWKATINLAVGAIKFRANNEWTINFGPADGNALSGSLVFDAQSAVSITEAGSYTVTADFSRMKKPYQFLYSIKKN